MEYKTFILKENSEEIRNQIEDAGISVCVCAKFDGACWLVYHTMVGNGVHGVGYFDEDVVSSVEEELARFTEACRNPIYCSDVEEFIASIKDFEASKNKG